MVAECGESGISNRRVTGGLLSSLSSRRDSTFAREQFTVRISAERARRGTDGGMCSNFAALQLSQDGQEQHGAAHTNRMRV